ncbi:hypothetical protein FJY93_01635 [Candidatus Kaiserbacteria bacterium]|nr:hypothetical protein [Candidatus Kaiserbacteria bacterium]
MYNMLYMTRNIEFATNEYYHIYNRGTEKRNIFSSKADYERFLALLYFANSQTPVRMDNIRQMARQQGRTLLEMLVTRDEADTLVDICVYCLMPNHFHILIREKEEGNTSKFIQKLSNGYTAYFNKRHERNGVLFQGKYKATHAADDVYLKYLISYIHLNPIKLIDPQWKENGITNRKDAKNFLTNYRYSSYLDYLGEKRPENHIIHMNALPEYFENIGDFESSVTEWLECKTP